MKTKSKHAQLKRKKEFRYKVILVKVEGKKIVKIRHPAYIFLEKGNKYIYVSITHSKKVKDKMVIKLIKNPNPNDKRNAYYVVEVRQDTKDKFGKRLNQWLLDENDDEEIRKLYEKR